MIETKGDTTIIRPTPGKWFTGAALFLLIGLVIPAASWLFLGLAALYAAIASGKLTRLELSPQGLKTVSAFKTRSYAWNDVEDFKIMSIRTSLFTSTKMLAFSRKDKKDTMMGKASRFFGGGTETVGILGIKPDELMVSIHGYETRNVLFGTQQSQTRDFGSATPASAPIPQKTKGAIGFGRPDRQGSAPAAQTPQPARAAQPKRPQAQAKPVFGRQSPSTPVRRTQTQKSNPLVEEGGLFRKRRDSTGF